MARPVGTFVPDSTNRKRVMEMTRILQSTMLITLIMSLSACGEGGGTSPQPTATPTATSTPTPTPVTLTMDDLPFQPVDGLGVGGVTFGFAIGGVPSSDASYGAFGPGIQHFAQDPVIEGTTQGMLTLNFAVPTAVLECDVTLSNSGTLMPGFSLQLFDARLTSLGVTDVDTSQPSDDSFSGGHFTYSGTPVLRAIVSFSQAAGRFAFDNLTFVGGGGAPGTPLCNCCACDFGGGDVECGRGDVNCDTCVVLGGAPAADCSVCGTGCSAGATLCMGNPRDCSSATPTPTPVVTLTGRNASEQPSQTETHSGVAYLGYSAPPWTGRGR